MTRLIVSVRSPDEAALALDASADVIDIKEPARGSLGAADPAVVQSIVESVARRRPVSVALGELFNCAVEEIVRLPPVDYVKLGLSRCEGRADWRTHWMAAAETLPRDARLVAVVYADAPRAGAPHWTEVLDLACDARSGILLVDTYDKCAGGLLDWFNREQLQELRLATRKAGVQLALAGSLTRRQIRELQSIEAEYVAVRSAVCPSGRAAPVSRGAIEAILADLSAVEG